MSDDTKIEWADSTFNPWIGCTKVSPGCDHCYAERQMDKRLGRVRWGAGQPRKRTSAAYWRQPKLWNAEADRFRECGACGWRGQIEIGASPSPFACPRCDAVDWRAARRRVFCASLADVFDVDVPTDWRRDIYALIERTPNLDWLVLTKRIGNARAMLGECSFGRWDSAPLPNIWLGATVVNQAEADRDIFKLLDTPAAKRFVSIEPMLSEVRLGSFLLYSPSAAFEDGRVTWDTPAWTRIGSTKIDWVIAGGESGPGARPMHPDWVRWLRDQCQAAGVPFLFKQWGEWAPGECVSRIQARTERAADWFGGEWLYGSISPRMGQEMHRDDEPDVYRIGKSRAGRLLDGREWSEFPA